MRYMLHHWNSELSNLTSTPTLISQTHFMFIEHNAHSRLFVSRIKSCFCSKRSVFLRFLYLSVSKSESKYSILSYYSFTYLMGYWICHDSSYHRNSLLASWQENLMITQNYKTCIVHSFCLWIVTVSQCCQRRVANVAEELQVRI